MPKYANMPRVQGVFRSESFPINSSLFVFGYKNPSFNDRELEGGEQNTSLKSLSCFFQSLMEDVLALSAVPRFMQLILNLG